MRMFAISPERSAIASSLRRVSLSHCPSGTMPTSHTRLSHTGRPGQSRCQIPRSLATRKNEHQGPTSEEAPNGRSLTVDVVLAHEQLRLAAYLSIYDRHLP